MFGKRKSTSTVASEPFDQYRIKSTGERVTLLHRIGGGEAKVARDRGGVCRDDIVSLSDITPV